MQQKKKKKKYTGGNEKMREKSLNVETAEAVHTHTHTQVILQKTIERIN